MAPESRSPSSGALPPLGPAVARSSTVSDAVLDVLLPPFAAGPARAFQQEEPRAEVNGADAPLSASDDLDSAVAAPELDAAEPDDSTEDAKFPGWMVWDDEATEDQAQPLVEQATGWADSSPALRAPEEPEASEEPLDGSEAWQVEDVRAAQSALAVVQTEDAEPSADALAEQPLEQSAGDGIAEEVADRLERIAASLRQGGIGAVAAHAADDPLALLVTGFVLGASQRTPRA